MDELASQVYSRHDGISLVKKIEEILRAPQETENGATSLRVRNETHTWEMVPSVRDVALPAMVLCAPPLIRISALHGVHISCVCHQMFARDSTKHFRSSCESISAFVPSINYH